MHRKSKSFGIYKVTRLLVDK